MTYSSQNDAKNKMDEIFRKMRVELFCGQFSDIFLKISFYIIFGIFCSDTLISFDEYMISVSFLS